MSNKWCTVVPLNHFGHLAVPFNLATDVVLTLAPNWLMGDNTTKDMSLDDREIVTRCRYVLLRQYEAEHFGEHDPTWKESIPRSKQDAALEVIQLADLALWLAKPSSIGFSRIVMAEVIGNDWTIVQFGRDRPLTPHVSDVNAIITKNDLLLAAQLHSVLIGLPRNGVLWIAARTLWTALKQMEWNVRYLFVWVVLESLYGSKNPGEITFRISQRIAFFLSSDKSKRQKLFESARTGYKWRSRVAHGMRLS